MNLKDYAAVLKDLAIPPRPVVVTVLFEEMCKDEPNLGRVTKTIARSGAVGGLEWKSVDRSIGRFRAPC
jgi:hypothetical protein